jgi:hypothetical protein
LGTACGSSSFPVTLEVELPRQFDQSEQFTKICIKRAGLSLRTDEQLVLLIQKSGVAPATLDSLSLKAERAG